MNKYEVVVEVGVVPGTWDEDQPTLEQVFESVERLRRAGYEIDMARPRDFDIHRIVPAKRVAVTLDADSPEEAGARAVTLLEDDLALITGFPIHMDWDGFFDQIVQDLSGWNQSARLTELVNTAHHLSFTGGPPGEDYDERGLHRRALEIGRELYEAGGTDAMLAIVRQLSEAVGDPRRAVNLLLCWVRGMPELAEELHPVTMIPELVGAGR